jgi:site-specific DNA-cytosine methylase
VFGGPPCQGFSQKGKRLSLDDERNYLFKYFLNVVEYVHPKAFVIENVPNLLTTSDSYFFNLIKEDCEKMGYTINAQILDASDFGVLSTKKESFYCWY